MPLQVHDPAGKSQCDDSECVSALRERFSVSSQLSGASLSHLLLLGTNSIFKKSSTPYVEKSSDSKLIVIFVHDICFVSLAVKSRSWFDIHAVRKIYTLASETQHVCGKMII